MLEREQGGEIEAACCSADASKLAPPAARDSLWLSQRSDWRLYQLVYILTATAAACFAPPALRCAFKSSPLETSSSGRTHSTASQRALFAAAARRAAKGDVLREDNAASVWAPTRIYVQLAFRVPPLSPLLSLASVRLGAPLLPQLCSIPLNDRRFTLTRTSFLCSSEVDQSLSPSTPSTRTRRHFHAPPTHALR